jgi:hypothetical protein
MAIFAVPIKVNKKPALKWREGQNQEGRSDSAPG